MSKFDIEKSKKNLEDIISYYQSNDLNIKVGKKDIKLLLHKNIIIKFFGSYIIFRFSKMKGEEKKQAKEKFKTFLGNNFLRNEGGNTDGIVINNNNYSFEIVKYFLEEIHGLKSGIEEKQISYYLISQKLLKDEFKNDLLDKRIGEKSNIYIGTWGLKINNVSEITEDNIYNEMLSKYGDELGEKKLKNINRGEYTLLKIKKINEGDKLIIANSQKEVFGIGVVIRKINDKNKTTEGEVFALKNEFNSYNAFSIEIKWEVKNKGKFIILGEKSNLKEDIFEDSKDNIITHFRRTIVELKEEDFLNYEKMIILKNNGDYSYFHKNKIDEILTKYVGLTSIARKEYSVINGKTNIFQFNDKSIYFVFGKNEKITLDLFFQKLDELKIEKYKKLNKFYSSTEKNIDIRFIEIDIKEYDKLKDIINYFLEDVYGIKKNNNLNNKSDNKSVKDKDSKSSQNKLNETFKSIKNQENYKNSKNITKNILFYGEIKNNDKIEINTNLKTILKNTREGNKYSFDDLDTLNIMISLKVKPFVILTGISGTGKSLRVKQIAKAIYGEENYNYFYKHVAVKPNWTDNTALFGYYNPLTQEYVNGELNDFINKAFLNPDKPFFVLLDEINLARVEYYMSDILSYMEDFDDEGFSGFIKLYEIDKSDLDDKKQEQIKSNNYLLKENGDKYEVGYVLSKNIFFVGTANIDETTHGFSNKVLDRCSVIEIENDYGTENEAIKRNEEYNFGDKMKFDFFSKIEKDIIPDYIGFLNEINQSLGLYSHRVANDIIKYCIIFDEYYDFYSLDYSIKQKILPKIKGYSEDLEEGLKDLYEKIQPYEKSRLKLEKMTGMNGKNNEITKDYITFWK